MVFELFDYFRFRVLYRPIVGIDEKSCENEDCRKYGNHPYLVKFLEFRKDVVLSENREQERADFVLVQIHKRVWSIDGHESPLVFLSRQNFPRVDFVQTVV